MQKFCTILWLLTACFCYESQAKESATTQAETLNHLGEQYHFGEGVAQDFMKAREFYLKAVELGSAPAANHLGRLYTNGEGVPKDHKEAQKWYRKSAELDPSLENKCLSGQHSDAALCGLIRSALQGSAPAEYELGALYEYGGAGIDIDLNKAFNLYRHAAEKGYAPAVHSLSSCYKDGKGVAQDLGKAQQWENRYKELTQ